MSDLQGLEHDSLIDEPAVVGAARDIPRAKTDIELDRDDARERLLEKRERERTLPPSDRAEMLARRYQARKEVESEGDDVWLSPDNDALWASMRI